MLRLNAITGMTTAIALCGAAGASATNLPTFGHYIGQGVVVSATSACPVPTGTTLFNQLEINTPLNRPVHILRTVRYDTGGAPYIEKVVFKRTGGTKTAPTGTITFTDEETGVQTTGTYTATYTPIDPNSFGADYTWTYTNSSGTCTAEHNEMFIRSSAD